MAVRAFGCVSAFATRSHLRCDTISSALRLCSTLRAGESSRFTECVSDDLKWPLARLRLVTPGPFVPVGFVSQTRKALMPAELMESREWWGGACGSHSGARNVISFVWFVTSCFFCHRFMLFDLWVGARVWTGQTQGGQAVLGPVRMQTLIFISCVLIFLLQQRRPISEH